MFQKGKGKGKKRRKKNDIYVAVVYIFYDKNKRGKEKREEMRFPITDYITLSSQVGLGDPLSMINHLPLANGA